MKVSEVLLRSAKALDERARVIGSARQQAELKSEARVLRKRATFEKGRNS